MKTTFRAMLAAACLAAMPQTVLAQGTETLFSVGVMTGQDATLYCNFMTETDAKAFAFDDERTWRFVFVSDFSPPEGSKEKAPRARAVINDRVEDFVFRNEKTDDDGVIIRRYRGLKDKELHLAVRMTPGQKGEESQAFTGRVIVQKGDWRANIGFSGDCGV